MLPLVAELDADRVGARGSGYEAQTPEIGSVFARRTDDALNRSVHQESGVKSRPDILATRAGERSLSPWNTKSGLRIAIVAA